MSAEGWTAFAPAKVNLFLHVGAAEGDGFHPLVSLAAFADVGDRLTARPAPAFSLTVEGPFASALDDGVNLIERAADAWSGGGEPPRLAITLDKRLPIAAGLGGGTSDGAAALRLFAEAEGVTDAARLAAAAARLGSDGPACLEARPVLMTGRGERLTPVRLPELFAVLANPGLPCPTGAVYAAFDELAGAGQLEAPQFEGLDAPSVLDRLAEESRNDLEPAALAVQPAVGRVLARLAALPEARLTRMSGSGATCCALTRDLAAARVGAARLAAEEPSWWVRACRLGDGTEAARVCRLADTSGNRTARPA